MASQQSPPPPPPPPQRLLKTRCGVSCLKSSSLSTGRGRLPTTYQRTTTLSQCPLATKAAVENGIDQAGEQHEFYKALPRICERLVYEKRCPQPCSGSIEALHSVFEKRCFVVYVDEFNTNTTISKISDFPWSVFKSLIFSIIWKLLYIQKILAQMYNS